MSYFTQLVIPASTVETVPVTVDVVLPPCLLTNVWMLFPSGCAGLVGTQVYYQSRQLLPFNQNNWYIADGVPILIDVRIDIKENPFTLEFRGYNEDDSYPHTVYINAGIDFAGDVKQLEQFLGTFLANQPILEGRL